jgi:hypothetical protein
VDQVSIGAEGGGGPSGAEAAKALVGVLNGNCDAVVAFEAEMNVFRLRPSPGAATAVSALYGSCELNERQEKLRATWHWDRDAERHCEWLGINPPDIAERNRRMIGAALMFESHLIFADQIIGRSLCDDLLYDRYWIEQGCDEMVVFSEKWGPTWLEPLGFLLSAWQKAASACGNTKPRTCTVRTAAHTGAWHDVLWFFVATSERFLSKCLGGEVRFDILAQPHSKQAKEVLHPRYIFASTRAIQSDRGFDLVEVKYRRQRPPYPERREERPRYAEITSRTLYDARHSLNVWTGGGLAAIPRYTYSDAELVWMPTMSTRPPSTLPGEQAGGPQATGRAGNS